jgi:glycosyltransferase involved in cell wall biosynthesis
MKEPEFKIYLTKNGEEILYVGEPDLTKLESLADGCGDVWHSSLDQGYKNAFPEIIYQTATFYWFASDLENLKETVSWRINPYQFAVRKTIWEQLNGFDADYENKVMAAFDLGFNLLRYWGGTVLYVQGLFQPEYSKRPVVSTFDNYLFYRKNFKLEQSYYMLLREGFWKYSQWKAFNAVSKKYSFRNNVPQIQVRPLNKLQGNPSVSYIIPTMLRQEWTKVLLDDLAKQSYLPKEVVIVDATPKDKRVTDAYTSKMYPFEVIVKWQTTQGSCRARNEAIELCSGEYYVFGDDDIRIPADFIENHIRFLQTYQVKACNGLDIRADHTQQDLNDLSSKLHELGTARWKSGTSSMFSNANSCVHYSVIEKLQGNDINFDGGYGEDSDFGLSIFKIGEMVLHNPYAVNLHLKPPVGGYRYWGSEAKKKGKVRKKQPWELDTPVKNIQPVPSPTIMYFNLKHFSEEQVKEYRHKYFFLYLFKGPKAQLLIKLVKLPYRILQFNKSVFYAQKLISLGKRTK